LSNLTEDRKAEHIKISLIKDINAKNVRTGFSDVHLIHSALPEIDRADVSLSTKEFGHSFSAPILVGAMTGGTREATKINSSIAKAVEDLGLGMGVGSQRAAIELPRLASTFKVVRKKAPSAFLVANIGAPQLVGGYGLKEVRIAVDMISADALAIHLNPLQEAVQPEGEVKYAGVLEKITEIAGDIDVPVIVKETGAGISAEVATKLEKAGVQGIDISGVGGTSWAAVEYHRAKLHKDSFRQHLGKCFWDWGIPTAVSLVEVAQSTKVTIIASGGVRAGIDIAKSIVLGSSLVSISTPILSPATKNSEEVKRTLQLYIEELRNAMFLVGATSNDDLKKTSTVILGDTAKWLESRGFNLKEYSRRNSP
jgi:isopentenyl-diphosphate delta-isomerase